MSDEIEMTEAAPGDWMTHSQAKAHRLVQRSIAKSDFTRRKSHIEKTVDRLPRSLRIGMFLLCLAAMLGVLFGPVKTLGLWLFYS